ncbi:serine/threonine-protein kinase [Glycomyces salinus]|uniref:serine/threonine-protein kinase n=1 Tax=Glycomyces salinus TaxID=980294 RepID=UPI0018ED5EC6|nr:serine/threonine-protein kinase [Glycomyces salinus]
MLSTRNLKAGDVLDGRYRLERRVGGGGMGDVWEATDTVLWRKVAVKVLLADLVDDRGFRERFRREARAIAAMRGSGVIEVYDYGEIDHGDSQLAYLIMEFVDGKPLSRLLGLWGKLPSDDTLRIVGGVAEALRAAHAAGIVHRDIKPGNILVRDDGSVVLVDFGIARANHNLTLTTTGVVLGTVTYMSPEQAAGENLTAASDLYSLGVVAHQCLAGSPPFKADTPLGVLSAHLRNSPPPLPPEVPSEVAGIVTRSLQKEPPARWPDAAALAEACRRTRAMLAAVPRPAPPSPPVSPTRIQSDPYYAGAAVTGGPQDPVTGPQPVGNSGAHRVSSSHPVPVTGAHAAPPPQAPGAPAPAEEPEPPRHRRRWAAIGGTIAAVAALGAVIITSPWDGPTGAGTAPSGQSQDDPAEVRGQGSGDEWAGDDDSNDYERPTESPSAGETPTAEDDESAPADDTEPSSGPTESTSPTPSPTESEAATANVPDLSGKTESGARQRLEEAGLAADVEYQGEGDHKCGVVGQSPASGTTVEEGSTVRVTVKRAADSDSCKSESDDSGDSGGGQSPPPESP